MNLDEYQTTFLFYAPAETPGGWNLDLAAFTAALEAAFPEVRYETRQGRQLRLSFWAVTEEGVEFTGFASNEGRDTVVLTDNTADEAAASARSLPWRRASRRTGVCRRVETRLVSLRSCGTPGCAHPGGKARAVSERHVFGAVHSCEATCPVVSLFDLLSS
ncbi:hypothetical protein [Streptomyces sp. YIM S03343]